MSALDKAGAHNLLQIGQKAAEGAKSNRCNKAQGTQRAVMTWQGTCSKEYVAGHVRDTTSSTKGAGRRQKASICICNTGGDLPGRRQKASEAPR